MSPNYDNNVVHEKWVNGERIVMGSGADKIYELCDKCGKEYELGWGHNCTPKTALDKQEGGNHYKDMKIQPVEFITANNLGFLEGNVVKYICRHHAKNGAEDIKKAIHYCELLLQTKYGD
jgi:hypothetical protein